LKLEWCIKHTYSGTHRSILNSPWDLSPMPSNFKVDRKGRSMVECRNSKMCNGNGSISNRIKNSCPQDNADYSGGHKALKCTTLTKALSEQGVARRQRPGSSSPIRPRASAAVKFGELHLQWDEAEQGGSPRREPPQTSPARISPARISWADACDEPVAFGQPQQSPRQQLRPQKQQEHQQHSRKWTKGSARASAKNLRMQPGDEDCGLQAGAASPRWEGDASLRGIEWPDATGQRAASTVCGVEILRDAGMGQQPHTKQDAGAASPWNPKAFHHSHFQKTWSTGDLSTAPSPNMPDYREHLHTTASTTSLSSPTPSSPRATPRILPGGSSAMASNIGVGSSFDGAYGDVDGCLHSSFPEFPSMQLSKPADAESGQWKQTTTRSMKDLRGTTPKQTMLRRASSMRPAGKAALPAIAEGEKLNRLSLTAQRASVANVDEVYGPYHGLSRKQGHQRDPRKFWNDPCRFLPDFINDPDKECFDDQVAHAMFGCSVLPRVAEHLTEGNLQRLKPAAFTDRSIRRREGGGCDAVFKGAANYSDRDSDCTRCPASATFPAGLVTSRLPINVPHTVHAGTEASIQPQSPSMRFRCRSGSPNFDSNGIKTTATFAAHKAEKQQQLQQQCQQEEDSFKRRIGRKARSTAQEAGPCSPRFVRPGLDLEASSDQYVRMGSPSVLPSDQLQRTQQGWAGRNRMDTPRRGHVAMTMSPRGDDPPLANSTITGCKKGNGDNKFLVSKDAERLFLRANPTMFRYEAGTHSRDFLRRSCSLPPECERRVRGEGKAFLMHLEQAHRDFTQADVTREMPALVSHNIQEVIQQSRVAESDAQSRAQRLVEDKRFCDLCTITDTTRMQMIAEMESLANTQTVSANMADSLTWSE